jgi:GntR family transcriptional regulator / MocR family aminotransferase
MTVYRQIYQRLRTSIEEGKLRAGDRLPSARALASELGVARGTVDAAYALLSGEGYVLSRGRGGTVVAPNLPLPNPGAGHRSPAAAPQPAMEPPQTPRWTLLPGMPALDLFPRKIWAQTIARRARRLSAGDLAAVDPRGSPALRAAVASYLAVARGVTCSPDQILVTGGYQAALGLLLRLLLKPGSQVWTEDPGYRPTRRAIEAMGASPVAVPVDKDGMDVEAAMRLSPNAPLCIVTPAHQFPLGGSLPLHRRLALLEWVSRTGGWILEDDYEGEFRHGRRALPALKSLDRDDRVFYVGTFSKTLFPGLRLGYVVAPAAQVGRLAETLRWLDGGRPGFEQAVVADFIAEGHFARHLKRMRTAYDGRRTALATAITETFGDEVHVDPCAGGLHLVVRFNSEVSDCDLAARAAVAGLRPVPLSPMSWAGDQGQGLLVGFGDTPERSAQVVAEQLRAAIA